MHCYRKNFYTAGASEDYIDIAADLTFPVGSQMGDTVCAPVIIIDDQLVEGDETFFLSLGTILAFIEISPEQATVTIIDDDCKFRIQLLLRANQLQTPSIKLSTQVVVVKDKCTLLGDFTKKSNHGLWNRMCAGL